MSVEENKELMRRWYEMDDFKGIGKDKMEKTLRKVVAEIFAPEWIAHSTQGDMTYEAFIQHNVAVMNAFPDFNCTVEEQIAEGDKVVIRLTMRGTHLGPYLGMPPTGKKIEVGGISIGRFADGKAIEGWLLTDTLGLMQQLGAIPKQ
jgi:steroid delta-isomerase-like uncharacterized protein